MSKHQKANKEKKGLVKEAKVLGKVMKKEIRRVVDPRSALKKRRHPVSVASRKSVGKLQRQMLPGSKEAVALANSLINPIGSSPMRLPTHTEGAKTAVSRLQQSYFYNTTGGSTGTYSLYPATDNLAVIFRDPLRAAVILQKSITAYSYTANFCSQNGTFGTTLTIPSATLNESIDLSPVYWKYTSGSQPHGTYLYPGMSQEYLYTWFDAGVVLTITFGATVSGEVTLTRWLAPGQYSEESVTNTVSSATSTTFTFTTSTTSGSLTYGYWNIQVLFTTEASNTTIAASFATSSTQDVFAHQAVPEIQQNINDYAMLRVNSAALLWSNEAAPLYKDGEIVGVNIPTTTPWFTITDTATMQKLAGYWDGKLATGIYAYLPMTNYTVDTAYNGYSTMINGTSTPSKCAFMLDAVTNYSIIRSTSLTNSGGTYPGQEFILHFCWHLEYQTTLQTADTEFCSLLSTELEKACLITARMPRFIENPWHLGMIAAALTAGFNFLVNYGPAIGNAIGSLVGLYKTYDRRQVSKSYGGYTQAKYPQPLGIGYPP